MVNEQFPNNNFHHWTITNDLDSAVYKLSLLGSFKWVHNIQVKRVKMRQIENVKKHPRIIGGKRELRHLAGENAGAM